MRTGIPSLGDPGVSGQGSVGAHSSQGAKRDNGMGCGRIAARKSR